MTPGFSGARFGQASALLKRKNMESKNIFESLPKDLELEVFEDIVSSSTVRVERIVSKGHGSADNSWYDQDENEWVMVVQGRASLAFEDGSQCDLVAGDYLNIPAHLKHKVVWTDPDEITIWLALFYR